MNISIVITTYNAEIFICETLLSIMQQTYRYFELIIVDDGSTDQTVEKILNFMENYPSISFFIYAIKHIGRASALHYAIEKANFEWIAIIDADDLWHIKKLELQVNCIINYQISFLATESRLFYNSHEIQLDESLDENFKGKLKFLTLDNMLYNNKIAHSSVLALKYLLKYDQLRTSQIDYELWLRSLQSNMTLYLLDKILVYHRSHPGQSFESKKYMTYAFNAIFLQLKYSIKNLKWIQTIYIIAKLGYYFLLPKVLRLKLRRVIIRSGNSRVN